jgi:hypothetical protein
MADFQGSRTGQPLEQRVARLEDIESIRQLKFQYALYCDNGYDADGMAALFVEDGVWESNAFGAYESRAEIHKFISGVRHEILWALHYMDNGIVEVADDGLSARGRWILFEPASMTREGGAEGADSVVITADYDDEFVKRDGRWWFKKVKANFRCISNLHEGWAAKPFRGQ